MLIEIEKKSKTYQFEANPGEKILHAGLRAGIPLPFECATGTCGSCKARVHQGDVDEGWPQAPGKEHFKAEKREILMCQCVAQSDCNLSVPTKIAAFREDDINPDHHLGLITQYQKLTSDVLRFEVTLPHDMTFHAGQFVVLQVPEVDGFRAYSMVNYVSATNTLEFIIKQNPRGALSKWAFDADRSNQEIQVFGPLGHASFHPDEGHDLFMIAGGSGVAGLMSILEHARQVDYFTNHRVALYFGVRTPDDMFFTERLIALKSQFPDTVSINIVFSNEPPTNEQLTGNDGLNYSQGMVHERALPAVMEGGGTSMHYLAGPAPMVDALIRPLILESKVPADRIRYDKFS